MPFSRKKAVCNDNFFRRQGWLTFIQKIDTPAATSSHVTPSTAHTAQTARVLEGAIGYFDTYEDKNAGYPSTITPASSNASLGSKRQWKFGTAPWHRRLSTIRCQHLVPYIIYWLEEHQWEHQNPNHVLLVQQGNHTRKVNSLQWTNIRNSILTIPVEISDPGAPTFLPSVSVTVTNIYGSGFLRT